MQKSLIVLACVSAAFAALSSEDINHVGGPGSCVVLHCAEQAAACLAETKCRSAMLCDVKCSTETNKDSCYFLCEALAGYNLTSYMALMTCMQKFECIPKESPDGTCIGNNSIGVKNITDMTPLRGVWWIVRGLNCGQEGWPGAFDAYPCQHNNMTRAKDGQWVTHFKFCGGFDKSCASGVVSLHANASIDNPGVITHTYTDTIQPLTEHWRLISWPHPDWILSVYCGVTPTLQFGGGLVMDRSQKPMPAYVEAEFRSTAKRFGFDYDTDMCVNDVSTCPDRKP